MNNKKELRIWRPCKSNYITQPWGVNWACAKINIYNQLTYPIKVFGAVAGICPLGTKSLYHLLGMKGHNGIDIATWYGEPTYHCANFDGWAKSEIDGSGGVGIDIVSNEPLVWCEKCQTKHYIKIRQWHCKQIMVADGTQVKAGDFIAYTDSTGASGGNHIHLGLKWCDKDGRGIHSDNGYYGAFNPEPYWENIFVLDVLKIKQKALTAIEQGYKLVLAVRQFIQGIIK